MSGNTGSRYSYATGPDENHLVLADLPPADTKRWVACRKAAVVAAVQGGLLSLDEACWRYSLTVEEYASWQTAMKQFGPDGLRATRMQDRKTRTRDERLMVTPADIRNGESFARL
jgi:hypothetical protein